MSYTIIKICLFRKKLFDFERMNKYALRYDLMYKKKFLQYKYKAYWNPFERKRNPKKQKKKTENLREKQVESARLFEVQSCM